MSALGVFLASIPFVMSLRPSARARASGGPVEVDLSRLAPGEVGTYLHRGRPILVLRRPPKMVERLSAVENRLLDVHPLDDPSYIQCSCRSIDPEYLVVEGVCTHLGCLPQWVGSGAKRLAGDRSTSEFICRCHGSVYDDAGRVIRGPAPRNLPIPPHRYLSATRLVIGEAPSGGP